MDARATLADDSTVAEGDPIRVLESTICTMLVGGKREKVVEAKFLKMKGNGVVHWEEVRR